MRPSNPHDPLLELLRQRAGLQPPGASQFEDLALEGRGDGPLRFSYGFDEDGHSQYDRTLRFTGTVRRDAAGTWHIESMRVDHVGVAALYAPAADLPRAPTPT